MKLYLMRHGEALSSQVDPECGLTDNGKLKIEKLAHQLKDKGLIFHKIYHSKKKRAQQTAEIMAGILSPQVKPELHQNITPNDDPHLILTDINSWKEDTLITSHLPFVPNLISLLTGQDAFLTPITFETGTIVCLQKNEKSAWNIEWFTCPSEI